LPSTMRSTCLGPSTKPRNSVAKAIMAA